MANNLHYLTWVFANTAAAGCALVCGVGVCGGGAPLVDALLRVSGVGNCEWDSSDTGVSKNDLFGCDSKMNYTWVQAQMMSQTPIPYVLFA